MRTVLLLLFTFFFLTAKAQWTQVFDAPGNTSNVKVFSSPNDSVCWFITNYDTLYKTMDGGANWTKAGTPSFVPSGLFVVNRDTAFKTGLSSIYKTVNGGVTWQNVFQSAGAEVPVVWMKDDLTGIFSYGGQLHKTTDGGNTWSTATINQPPVNVLNSAGKGSICNSAGDSLWVTLVGGGIAFSPDYGSTWTVPSNTGWTSTGYANISFESQQFGLAIMHSNPFVYKTIDGGNNWTQSINSLGSNEDVVVKGSHCWFIPDPADHFFIKYSADSGVTWTQQLFESTGFYVLDKSRVGNSLWAGTGNGKVYKYTDVVATSVNSISNMNLNYQITSENSEGNFILKSYSGNKNCEVIISDISGRQLNTFFVNGESIIFGSALKAGCYIVTIYENGKIVFEEKVVKAR